MCLTSPDYFFHMKNKIILILLLLNQFAFSQESSFEFQSTQNSAQVAWEAIQDSQGNYVITSQINDGESGQSNPRLWKLDEDGNLIISQNIEYNNLSVSAFFLKEIDDHYICIGNAINLSKDSSFVWIAEISMDLNLLKDTLIYSGNLEIGPMQCNDELNTEILCLGNFVGLSGLPNIPFGFKHFIESGNTEFNYNLGVTDLINDIIPHPQDSNKYILNGQRTYKSDENFNILDFIESPGVFRLRQQGDIHPLTDSTFLISGKYSNLLSGERYIGLGIASYDLEEIKLDTFGRMGDTIDFPGFFQSIDFKTKDKIYCGGTSNIQIIASPPYGTMPSWFVLAQYDSLLNRNWKQYYGGDAYYNMFGLIATQDDGCLMYGRRHDYQNNPGILELYVLKVNAGGQLVSTTTLPLYEDDFVVYPNPFNDQIHINVSDKIPTQNFQVELYDLQGKLLITTKVNDNSFIINTNTLAVGAYICVIKNQQGEVLGKRKLIKSR